MNREDAIHRAITLAYSEEMAEARQGEFNERAKASRYERSRDPLLTVALDDLVTDGFADEEIGEADTHGHYARIEQWIVGTNNEGFVLLHDHKTPEAAQVEFEEIRERIERLDGPYSVSRMYQSDDWPSEVVATGLSLAEAQARCKDPETSSSTCTSEEGRARTAERGPWFEGYEREAS